MLNDLTECNKYSNLKMLITHLFYWTIFTSLAVTCMISQLTVPTCDGPILLLLDVLTCRVGTLSLKAQRGQAWLLPRFSQVQLLCKHGIDPPAVTELPVECSCRAMAVLTAEGSHGWFVICSRVFAPGRSTLLSLHEHIIYALCVMLVLD